MVDFRGPPYQFASRKPLPPQPPGNDEILRPLTKIVPDSHFPPAVQQQMNSTSSHSRSRTSSSSVFPQVRPTSTSSPQRQNFAPSSYQNTMNTNAHATRRTPSNATASTSTTGGHGFSPARTHSNVSVSLRRSTSSRSGASTIQCGYVALMRKQKATVWCDRSQHEDPRFLAQQKAARLRAVMEVNGGNQGRTSTSGSLGSGGMGVRSKIRHHGAPKAVGYTPASLAGGGVPMRLSASEVGDEGSEDEDADSARLGQRTESGRSSFGSNRRYGGSKLPGRFSQGSTPPSGQGSSPEDEIPELAETPIPGSHQRTGTIDYFTNPSGQETPGGSGSSGERQFGEVGKLPAPSGTHLKPDTGKSADDLRRRGSVDDRTMTMSGVRLFVANPDLSD
ncbi:MAG: hypothetical protein M1830_001381 [Pleopsidium flavum]|nr:MAG: hypothetical protein M1830_001381 [Pleopsidium flavum]